MASIESLLHDGFRDYLKKKIIDSKEFPWYYYDSCATGTDGIQQFMTLVYLEGDKYTKYADDILKVLDYFEEKTGHKVKRVIRVKANLATQSDVSDEDNDKTIHRDFDQNNPKIITMVYYVNDSDGDTIVYDNEMNEIERCSPVAGNAVWFNAEKLHRGTIPVYNKIRVVINYVFEIE